MSDLENLLDSSSDEDYDSDIEIDCPNGDETDVEDIVEVESDIDEFIDDDDCRADNNEDYFNSKSGMKWYKNPPVDCTDINLSTSPKLKSGAENVESFEDAFFLFITKNMIKDICNYTNSNLQNAKKDFKIITEMELEAFIGILLASGKNRSRKVPFNELWKINCLTRHHYATAAMARDRFSFIFSNLRFDQKSTRDSRTQNSGDKLEAIKTIYHNFNEACTKYFDPSHVCIDERLAKYRGRCPFRVYMKSKPGRYGIKIWSAADGKTSYILNTQVYTGKINNAREINQGQRVVLDLVRPYFGSNLGVTCDNFFTSIPLAENLLEQKYISQVLYAQIKKKYRQNSVLPLLYLYFLVVMVIPIL